MTALAEQTIDVMPLGRSGDPAPESIGMWHRLEIHAAAHGVTVADLADLFAHQFFDLGRDTNTIARERMIPEATVYNAIHVWRESGMIQ